MNGHNYHIDPTYVIGDPVLDYFMMDDAQREAADDYRKESFVITSNYAQDHPHPDYSADDRTFSPLWGGEYVSIDHASKILHYRIYDDDWQPVEMVYCYGG